MTVYGWDASHYDAVPDGARVVSEGFRFMTHKAGGDADDAELAAWWSAIKGRRTRLLLGAYWVLYPGSASSRADTFLARLDSQCPGWRDGPFILQADCEQWNGDASTVPSKADIKTFCDRLVAKVPKLKPIVYAPQWVYGESLAGLKYPLWASSYVTGSGTAAGLYPGDSSSRWDAYSGQTPAILQFTSSATIAGQATSDANAYRGTLAQLTALVAPGWTEDDVELTDKYGDVAWPKRTVQNRLKDDAMLRDVLWGDVPGTKVADLDPDSPLAKLLALPDQMTAMAEAMANLSSSDAPLSIAAPTDRAVLDALAGDSVDDIVAALKEALGDKTAAVAAGLTS
jgi:GH25 family lysozyme M1 (1,4-beta-N-acetylmuramidase)